MAVKIRLSRGGAKKRPFYRIVAADERSPRDGKFLEKLGTYNPMLPKDSEHRTILNVEAIQAWIKKGAQPTDRVSRMLEKLGLIPAKKRNNLQKSVVGKKRADRAAEKAAKQAAPASEDAADEASA